MATATSTRGSQKTFSEIFEREVAVFFVGTGTAANSLSLVALNKPGGISFCHREAHIIEDECGAPEYLHRRLAAAARRRRRSAASTPTALDAAIARFAADNRPCRPADGHLDHPGDRGRHGLLASTRSTRSRRVAKAHGLPLHMDGARFANALVSLGRDAGRDDLEARRRHPLLRRHQERLLVRRGGVLFDLDTRRGIRLHPQARGAALFQVALHRRAVRRLFRGRSVAGDRPPRQRHGGTAGRAHRRLGKARLAWEPQANEVFAIMPRRRSRTRCRRRARSSTTGTRRTALPARSAPDEKLCRFVTSFATTDGRGGSVRRTDRLIALHKKGGALRTPPSRLGRRLTSVRRGLGLDLLGALPSAR